MWTSPILAVQHYNIIQYKIKSLKYLIRNPNKDCKKDFFKKKWNGMHNERAVITKELLFFFFKLPLEELEQFWMKQNSHN